METVAELETIKWLLVAILIGMVFIALSAVTIAAIHWLGFGVLKEQLQGKVFRRMAEDFLAKSENTELIEYSEERLSSHPHDVWAHWYLGQAKYHKGIYPEAKRCFERVNELEPSWINTTESWLEKVNDKINEGPQLVD